MANSNVSFSTSVQTIPANSSVSYGNNGASPDNFYQASITINSATGNADLSVTNGWQCLNGGTWNGPYFLITNKSSVDVTCNLQVVAIGPSASALNLEQIK
jgi:hypothetical protein